MFWRAFSVNIVHFAKFYPPEHGGIESVTEALAEDHSAAGHDVEVVFTPHLIPMQRGILCSIYARPAKPASEAELLEAMRTFYAGKPFVRVVDAGSQSSFWPVPCQWYSSRPPSEHSWSAQQCL